MPTLLPDDEWDHWSCTEDDEPDPIDATITITAEEGEQDIVLRVIRSEYERPDRSVGAHGGWMGTLSDGREFVVEDGWAWDGHIRIGKLEF
jgi:hypothetical protein